MKTSFGAQLSREEMKNILGGLSDPPDYCNAYCGSGSGVTCGGKCSSCEDAGNGAGSGKGQDKICYA